MSEQESSELPLIVSLQSELHSLKHDLQTLLLQNQNYEKKILNLELENSKYKHISSIQEGVIISTSLFNNIR